MAKDVTLIPSRQALHSNIQLKELKKKVMKIFLKDMDYVPAKIVRLG
jgi:hypothetical protein